MINSIEKELERLYSAQREKPEKTYVARYKNKNLKMASGKSSWKRPNHAKAAIINHFSLVEDSYVYGWSLEEGRSSIIWNKFSYEETIKRGKEFREELWRLIEIVELV